MSAFNSEPNIPFPPKGCGITHDEWLAMRARYREMFPKAKQRAIDEYYKARERDGVPIKVVCGSRVNVDEVGSLGDNADMITDASE